MKHSHQWNIENWKCWNSIKSVMTIMGTNPHNLFTLSINQGFWEVSVKGIKYCKWLILHDCSVLFRTIARTRISIFCSFKFKKDTHWRKTGRFTLFRIGKIFCVTQIVYSINSLFFCKEHWILDRQQILCNYFIV